MLRRRTANKFSFQAVSLIFDRNESITYASMVFKRNIKILIFGKKLWSSNSLYSVSGNASTIFELFMGIFVLSKMK